MGQGDRALRGIFQKALSHLLRQTVEDGGARGGQTLSAEREAELRARARKEAQEYAQEIRDTWPRRRQPAMVAVGINYRTGESYRAYSRERPPLPAEVERLLPSESRHNWPVDNCAEVAIASKAVHDGREVHDLVMEAVDIDGTPREPCLNCRTWVPNWRRDE